MGMVHVLDLIAPVAVRCPRCPNGTLIRAYIDAAHDLLTQSRWLRVAIQAATSADVRQYSLGGDPYQEVIGVRAASVTQPNGTVMSVDVSDPGGWNPNASTGMPRRYAYIPEGQIAFDVVPDAVYQMRLTLVVAPKRGQVHINDAVLPKWGSAIEAGALHRLLRLKEPWQDIAGADREQRAFQAGINNAKADEQREYNRGSQRATPRAIF